MKKFTFPFERVIEWRDRTAEKEKVELQRLHAVRTGLERKQHETHAAIAKTAVSAAAEPGMRAEDLRQAAAFVASLRNLSAGIQAEQTRCRSEIDAQMRRCVDADRDHKLLVELKKKRLSEWTMLFHRESEQIAADTWQATHGPSAPGSDKNTAPA